MSPNRTRVLCPFDLCPSSILLGFFAKSACDFCLSKAEDVGSITTRRFHFRRVMAIPNSPTAMCSSLLSCVCLRLPQNQIGGRPAESRRREASTPPRSLVCTGNWRHCQHGAKNHSRLRRLSTRTTPGAISSAGGSRSCPSRATNAGASAGESG